VLLPALTQPHTATDTAPRSLTRARGISALRVPRDLRSASRGMRGSARMPNRPSCPGPPGRALMNRIGA